MFQSRLPECFEENTIEKMLPGETGYTVPWAMFADEDGLLWINKHYTIFDTAFGTAHLLIRRTTEGAEVFQSTIGDHKYQAQASTWTMNGCGLPVLLLKEK